MRSVLLGLALLLAGCAAAPERAEVRVPIATIAAPPAELLAPIETPAPGTEAFVAPSDRRAVLGITEAGRQDLVAHIDALRRREAAWRAWATEPQDQ